MIQYLLTAALAGSFAFADTAKEDVHDAKRAMKKGAHRLEEKTCAEGDAKCAAKKLKHRAQESKDYMQDKVDENSPSKD
jgi:hypothetical protein